MAWTRIVNHEGKVVVTLPSPVLDRYRIRNPDGTEPIESERDDTIVRAVGDGGFGTVVRVADRVELPRALKIINPAQLAAVRSTRHSRLYTPGYDANRTDSDSITARLSDEIRNTNALPFKNIVPIIDYGNFRDADGATLPFYVSPFIPGTPLDKYFIARRPTESDLNADRSLPSRLHDLILALIDDLLRALTELADAGVVHMDLKPANIMVMRTVDPTPASGSIRDRLFVIDLGAAISAHGPRRDRVHLIITPRFFPTHLLNELGFSRSDGMVSHQAIVQHGRQIDMFAVGRTLELLFLDRVRRGVKDFEVNDKSRAVERAKELLSRRVLGDDFAVIEGLIERLMKTNGDGFASPDDAQLAFQTVARHESRSVLASRILTDQSPGLRVNVGGTMVRVAPPFDKIVNHPVFQRLRRLNQLALISELYPDATHTRFAHVLKVFHLTKYYLLSLNRDTNFRLLFTQSDVHTVLAAALIHDLGQYPFSHTIEDLRKVGDLCNIPHLSKIAHDQELAHRYIDRTETGVKSIRTLLEDADCDVDSVLYMFQKSIKDPARSAAVNIGRDLISGIIDVDRVAYLQHDSERTGVPYGRALDVDVLGESLCIYPEHPALAIDERGVSAVEGVLAAVYWMYRNVYWNPGNRGFMAAVKYVMEQLTASGEMTFEQYAEHVYGRNDWDALMFLDESYSRLSDRSGMRWHNPLRRIVEQRRFAYTRVCSLGFDGIADGGLYDKMLRDPSPTVTARIIDGIVGRLPRAADVRPGEILLDLPLKKRLRAEHSGGFDSNDTKSEAGARPLLMVRRRRRFEDPSISWADLYECSPLAASLGRIEDHSGRKIRVFFANELLTRVPPNVASQLGTLVRQAMEESAGK